MTGSSYLGRGGKRFAARMLSLLGVAAALVSCQSLTMAQGLPKAEQIAELAGVEITADIRTAIEDGVKKLRISDLDGARKLFQEAKKKEPKLPPGEVILANYLVAINQPQAARGELERAARLSATDPEAYIVLGDVALQEGKVTEASLLFNRAAELCAKYSENPKRKKSLSIRAYAGLAAADEATANSMGDEGKNYWTSAKPNLEEWIKLDAENSTPLLRLSNVQFKLKDSKSAYDSLRKAVAADKKANPKEPKIMPADLTMANYYMQSGDKEQAKKFMDAVIKSDPTEPQAQLAIAQYMVNTRQYNEAEKHAEKAVSLAPKNLQCKLARALIARLQEDYKTSVKYLEEAHMQAPGNSMISNQLALVLIEMPEDADKARALDFAQLNYSRNQDSPEAAATYGWICYQQGRMADAERAFNTLSRVNSRQMQPDWYYYLAKVFSEMGRDREALKFAQAALASDQPFVYEADAKNLRMKLERKIDSGDDEQPKAKGK